MRIAASRYGIPQVRNSSRGWLPAITKTRLHPQGDRRAFHLGHGPLLQQQGLKEAPSNWSWEEDIRQPPPENSSFVTLVETPSDGETLTVGFQDSQFKFHAQWLHDAHVEKEPSKDAGHVFSLKSSKAQILDSYVAVRGARSTVNVIWSDGSESQFPLVWLRALAPLVARNCSPNQVIDSGTPTGWLARELVIPEVSYSEIFSESTSADTSTSTKERILDSLLQENAAGVIKVVGLPAADLERERNKENTLVTKVLKQLFGSVFFHSRRGADKTFNIASHHEGDRKRGLSLPNYNVDKVLLPHSDHSHYTHPARVQGLYSLEGESENTFVSCFAVLNTLKQEAPHLYESFCSAPMVTGRVAHFYNPSMYQSTTDTAVTMQPGFPNQIKRFRWHPHLTGSLLSPYNDFPEARVAHRTFQEIMNRDSHLFRFTFKPGDLYVWDNARILHGRQRVLRDPRTAVGQTVPEQVVLDQYRELKMAKLKGYVDERWLVHTPMQQLHEMAKLVDSLDSGY